MKTYIYANSQIIAQHDIDEDAAGDLYFLAKGAPESAATLLSRAAEYLGGS